MPYLLLQSLTDFLVLVPCNVHIGSHSLNKQQEQITLLEGENTDFIFFNGKGLEPIVLLWKCQNGNIMKLCGECNNCTKCQFSTEKVFRDIPLVVILHHFVHNVASQVIKFA